MIILFWFVATLKKGTVPVGADESPRFSAPDLYDQ